MKRHVKDAHPQHKDLKVLFASEQNPPIDPFYFNAADMLKDGTILPIPFGSHAYYGKRRVFQKGSDFARNCVNKRWKKLRSKENHQLPLPKTIEQSPGEDLFAKMLKDKQMPDLYYPCDFPTDEKELATAKSHLKEDLFNAVRAFQLEDPFIATHLVANIQLPDRFKLSPTEDQKRLHQDIKKLNEMNQ